MGDSKTFGIPEAKGLKDLWTSLNTILCETDSQCSSFKPVNDAKKSVIRAYTLQSVGLPRLVVGTIEVTLEVVRIQDMFLTL